MASHPALFLDRDGVINIDHAYVCKPDNFEFIDGIFELCRKAKSLGYMIFVITNQAGIGRGYYTEQDFLNLTEWMTGEFKKQGVEIDKVYFCPSHPEHGIGKYKVDSLNRKPNPGMILKAAEKYELDLKHSIMIGDKDSDMQAAIKAGISKRCQYLSDSFREVKSDAATHYIYNLQEAVALLRV